MSEAIDTNLRRHPPPTWMDGDLACHREVAVLLSFAPLPDQLMYDRLLYSSDSELRIRPSRTLGPNLVILGDNDNARNDPYLQEWG